MAMIIDCPFCKKKFEIDENLIPEIGRTLQCGACDQKWFFKKQNIISTFSKIKKKEPIISKKKEKQSSLDIEKNISNITNKKSSEIVKYEPKFNFTLGNFLSYILVIIISFVGLIILLDTFKMPLYEAFPKLEFFLISFYETLKDVQLFIKDMI